MNVSDSTRAISANTRVLALPTLLLILLVLLFVFVLKSGIEQVLVLKSRVARSREEEKILSQKLALLSKSQESSLSLADLSLLAVPPERPTLMVISLLKSFATEKGVTIKSIEATAESAPSEESMSQSDIKLKLEGNSGNLFEYLKVLKTMLPLNTLGEIKISQEAGIARADIELSAYFIPLPTILPAITTPMNELSAEEKDILAKISTYSQPTFTELAPSGPYERGDLFNF